jgi:hypothetical protein
MYNLARDRTSREVVSAHLVYSGEMDGIRICMETYKL